MLMRVIDVLIFYIHLEVSRIIERHIAELSSLYYKILQMQWETHHSLRGIMLIKYRNLLPL